MREFCLASICLATGIPISRTCYPSTAGATSWHSFSCRTTPWWHDNRTGIGIVPISTGEIIRPATIWANMSSSFVTSNGHATDNYPGTWRSEKSVQDEVRQPINLTRQYPATVRVLFIPVSRVCSTEQKVFQIKQRIQKTQTANKTSKKFETLTKKPRKRRGEKGLDRPWRGSSHKLQQ